jgi:hypothetical protein
VKPIAVLLAAAALLAAQQFKFDFAALSAKASHSVDISLGGPLLQLAAKFLDSDDPDEAKVKKLIANLQGIYIRSFQFKKDAQWSPADLDSIRVQLKAPEWSRIVGYQSTDDGETAEVYLRTENQKISGVAILATQPRQFTVVNIVGPVDMDALADLSGHFNIPKLEHKK